MTREIRYQGAIIDQDRILLIRHREHKTGRSYWVFPGGGIQAGETEQQCVIREMREETCLTIQVDRLLVDEPGHPGGVYRRRKTYLCHPIDGVAKPGFEPEEEAAAAYGIVEVAWFDLRDGYEWDNTLLEDPITFPQLQRIRRILGYT
jgi:8-oxo-dGTP pyrophosphatase MutT (NUDIX family)